MLKTEVKDHGHWIEERHGVSICKASSVRIPLGSYSGRNCQTVPKDLQRIQKPGEATAMRESLTPFPIKPYKAPGRDHW